MQIAKNIVAVLDYELKTDEGEVLDSSKEGASLAYLHGHGNLVPGLEDELEGKTDGDAFQVRIPADEGYGERNEEMLQSVARSQFPTDVDLVVGMQFQAETEHGPQIVTVVGVEGDTVQLDENHPLAGVALNFDVKVVQVREATEEELAHGHVHGDGGHEH